MAITTVVLTYIEVQRPVQAVGRNGVRGRDPRDPDPSIRADCGADPRSMAGGHSPRISIINQDERVFTSFEPLGGYPHSLYLFLLFGGGVVGLLAYFVLFGALLLRWGGCCVRSDDPLLDGLPKLALLLMSVFFVSQLKLSFLHQLLDDYQYHSSRCGECSLP